MDDLPSELLLKIAGFCDFSGVYAMSMVNKRCYELIDSNWNSLKKAEVQCTVIEEDGVKDVKFERWCGRRTKTLSFKVLKGSENVNASEVLKNGWTVRVFGDKADEDQMVLRPKDVDEFLEEFFTPIFRRSNFPHHLELDSLKSPTLQVMIALFERFHPKVDTLFMDIGSGSFVDIQCLTDSARFIELSNPGSLDFRVPEWFAKKEFREHFLQRIAKLNIFEVEMRCQDFASGPDSSAKQSLCGPLPKCTDLVCEGSDHVSGLAIPDIVDLVEEWSLNKRDIENYTIYKFSDDMEVVAAQFVQALMERNLPIKLEVVQENFEFFIEKTARPGDTDVLLYLTFEDPEYDEGNVKIDDDCVRIESRRRR